MSDYKEYRSKMRDVTVAICKRTDGSVFVRFTPESGYPSLEESEFMIVLSEIKKIKERK